MRTHHLHLIPYGSPLWHDRLRFRDLLRTDSTLAAQYAALKMELALKFEVDEGSLHGRQITLHRPNTRV